MKTRISVDSVIYRNTDFENPRALWKIYEATDICTMNARLDQWIPKIRAGLYMFIYMYVRVYIYNWLIALNWDVHAICREPAHRPKYCTVLRNITRHRHLLLHTKSFSRFRAYWSRFINIRLLLDRILFLEIRV